MLEIVKFALKHISALEDPHRDDCMEGTKG